MRLLANLLPRKRCACFPKVVTPEISQSLPRSCCCARARSSPSRHHHMVQVRQWSLGQQYVSINRIRFQVQLRSGVAHIGIDYGASAPRLGAAPISVPQVQASKNDCLAKLRAQFRTADLPCTNQFTSRSRQTLSKIASIRWNRCGQEDARLCETVIGNADYGQARIRRNVVQ
jgi:hypothetical protein